MGLQLWIGKYRKDTLGLQLHSNVSKTAIIYIIEALNNLILNFLLTEEKVLLIVNKPDSFLNVLSKQSGSGGCIKILALQMYTRFSQKEN